MLSQFIINIMQIDSGSLSFKGSSWDDLWRCLLFWIDRLFSACLVDIRDMVSFLLVLGFFCSFFCSLVVLFFLLLSCLRRIHLREGFLFRWKGFSEELRGHHDDLFYHKRRLLCLCLLRNCEHHCSIFCFFLCKNHFYCLGCCCEFRKDLFLL